MQFETLKQKTGNLLFLTKQDLKVLEPDKHNLDANIKYWFKNNELTKIKNGFYLITEKYQNEDNKTYYLEYLANQIVKPSYLSGEYVLSQYNLLTEAVYVMTSVTTKVTREINNKLADFKYYSINSNLFFGFVIKKFNHAFILEAIQEKALFDFLYFRFFKNNLISLEDLKNLRINWENISRKKFLKSKKYFDLSNNQNMKKIYNLILQNFL